MNKKILIGVGILVLIIAALAATGSFKFSFRGAPKENQASAKKTNDEFVLPQGWVKYTSGEFGYSVAYPDGWNVQEKNTGNREVLLTAPKNFAFVRIAAFKDSTITSQETIEASIADYKASFNSKPQEQLKEFKSEMGDGL